MKRHGLIIINKPAGWTSHQCVAALKKQFQLSKAGHTGTLDPPFTGVLPVCFGQATRIAEFFMLDEKQYTARIVLGKKTATQDHTGDVTEDCPFKSAPGRERIEEVVHQFSGWIQQIPPMYSAVKKQGKRLYEYAREGKEVQREARTVNIKDIRVLTYDSELPYPHIEIEVKCSKGTYIRTLAEDIGQCLGYPAHLDRLVRTQSGPFHISDSYHLSDVLLWSAEEWHRYTLPIDFGLQRFPAFICDYEQSRNVYHGRSLEVSDALQKNHYYRLYDQDDQFMAIYKAVDHYRMKPHKVFHL